MGGASERIGLPCVALGLYPPLFLLFPPRVAVTAGPSRPRPSRPRPPRPRRSQTPTGYSGLLSDDHHPAMPAPHPRDAPHDAPLPPAAFDDFQLFNPALHAAVPPPPPLPPSNELFSQSETTDFFGFLDNFDWDFNIDGLPQLPDVPDPLYHSPLQETAPPGLEQLPPSSSLFNAQQEQLQQRPPPPQPKPISQPPHAPLYTQPVDTKPPARSRSRSPSSSASPASRDTPASRVKPLLSCYSGFCTHLARGTPFEERSSRSARDPEGLPSRGSAYYG